MGKFNEGNITDCTVRDLLVDYVDNAGLTYVLKYIFFANRKLTQNTSRTNGGGIIGCACDLLITNCHNFGFQYDPSAVILSARGCGASGGLIGSAVTNSFLLHTPSKTSICLKKE